MLENGYHTINFSEGSIIAVKVLILEYNMKDNSFGREAYTILEDGSVVGRMPRPSQKRNAGYHIDVARKKGAAFRYDLLERRNRRKR